MLCAVGLRASLFDQGYTVENHLDTIPISIRWAINLVRFRIKERLGDFEDIIPDEAHRYVFNGFRANCNAKSLIVWVRMIDGLEECSSTVCIDSKSES